MAKYEERVLRTSHGHIDATLVLHEPDAEGVVARIVRADSGEEDDGLLTALEAVDRVDLNLSGLLSAEHFGDGAADVADL
eukprot:scaffold25176_cov30-Tisochrysis_lutea.AAC.3